MQRNLKSRRTGRHALFATGAALVLAASSAVALVGAGSASAAESPQASTARPTLNAQKTPDTVCFITRSGTKYCVEGSSFRPYYAILKALRNAPGSDYCLYDPFHGIYTCSVPGPTNP